VFSPESRIASNAEHCICCSYSLDWSHFCFSEHENRYRINWLELIIDHSISLMQVRKPQRGNLVQATSGTLSLQINELTKEGKSPEIED